MAIEKGLYAAPQSIDEGDEFLEADLEIEIVNPDMVTLDDGSVEITPVKRVMVTTALLTLI